MDNKPVTKEMMEIYIRVLEKQVQQMTLVVTTIEELNDKLEKIEGHFQDGFKDEITEHIAEHIKSVIAKMDTALTTIYMIKEFVDRAESADKELSDKAFMLTSEVKDKISGLKGDISELKSAIKVDRITNIVGLGTFVIGILTIILKLFGKQ